MDVFLKKLKKENVLEITPIRSGLRKRKREETPRNTAPQVSEVWVDESKLELVEIKQFHERCVILVLSIIFSLLNNYFLQG